MEMTGKITQVLPEKSGTSARGPWRKQEYILETSGEYPKPVCFMVWGDRIDQFAIREGQELRVSVNLESREFNGRWYTDVKAWRVEPADGDQIDAAGSGSGEPPPHFDDEPPF
jgi:hypothetical protein